MEAKTSFAVMSDKTKFRSTTVIGVLHNGQVALGSDGQATMGDVILKHNAKKVRSLFGGTILAGFAGATADAFTLFDLFEKKLQEYRGNELRAAVELAKEWRTDRYLRRLEAMLAIASMNQMLLISGTGDVIEPDDNIIAVGSGGNYARAAARALIEHVPTLTARQIVETALNIAADLCVYTNKQQLILELPDPTR